MLTGIEEANVESIGKEKPKFDIKKYKILNTYATNLNVQVLNGKINNLHINKELIKKINLEENRFGFEPEFTAKISKLKPKIYEVGISYFGRTYKEGKKIGWRDGFRALWCIVKYNLK